MRVLVLLGLVLLAAVPGCALRSAPVGPRSAVMEAAILEAPIGAVWGALPAVYNDLGLEVSFADSAAHTLASTRGVDLWLPIVGPRDAPYARCTVPALTRTISAGAPVRLPPGRVMLTVETSLAETASGTRVQTHLRASPVGGGSDAPYCVSTGRLEAQIADALQQKQPEPL